MQHKIQVLVVEDMVIVAENTRVTLEELNYEVVAVCNSFDEAALAIKNQHFDVALLDINLNEGDERTGIALAEIINNTVKKPFVFLTAYNDRDTIIDATRQSPFGYLIKPVNTASLFAAIQVAIANTQISLSQKTPLQISDRPAFFFSKIGNRIIRIHWADIKLIQATKNYIQLFTIEKNTQPHLLRTSLAQALSDLMPTQVAADFLKPNRSILLSRDEVTEVNVNLLTTKHFGNFEITALGFDKTL